MLPPWGTSAAPASAQRRTTSLTCAVSTWSDDESGLAAVAPGPVDGVRGRDVGIGEHVLGPDDLGERSRERGRSSDGPQQEGLQRPSDGTLVVEQQGVG